MFLCTISNSKHNKFIHRARSLLYFFSWARLFTNTFFSLFFPPFQGNTTPAAVAAQKCDPASWRVVQWREAKNISFLWAPLLNSGFPGFLSSLLSHAPLWFLMMFSSFHILLRRQASVTQCCLWVMAGILSTSAILRSWQMSRAKSPPSACKADDGPSSPNLKNTAEPF